VKFILAVFAALPSVNARLRTQFFLRSLLVVEPTDDPSQNSNALSEHYRVHVGDSPSSAEPETALAIIFILDHKKSERHGFSKAHSVFLPEKQTDCQFRTKEKVLTDWLEFQKRTITHFIVQTLQFKILLISVRQRKRGIIPSQWRVEPSQ
jgi:hypothetical protein